ncbi:pseudouridine synthase [Phlebopus sp. FC_14]|nr:pseudouridine synthase [Phlebopus sp. FC_14]
MPKVSIPQLPLSGLFAVSKPSGPTSMSVLEDVKQLVVKSRLFVESGKLEKRVAGKGKSYKRGRDTVKIGQGGTLDPLADGVLGKITQHTLVGVGKGTKRLNELLDCVKEYRTTALLGCETDTYDSEGVRVGVAPWRHVTREAVETMLDSFRGEIHQTPPIFSALKMDGKPLYEYARQGIPLPRPIDKRKVTVHSLEIVDWKGSDHGFRWPKKELTVDEKKAMEKAMGSIGVDPVTRDQSEETSEQVPSAFVLTMKVSGGTYVRSIVHDLGRALGSAAHVVTLTRSRQGRFALEPVEGEEDKGCIPWEVFKRAAEDEGQTDEDGWTEWERQVLDQLVVVEGPNKRAQ